MRYLIMIWHDPTSPEPAEAWRAYAELDESLIVSGELVVSEALADPSQGRRLPATAEQPLTTEQLAGFYLVDCETHERAMEIASGLGLTEVRPTLAMTGPDV